MSISKNLGHCLTFIKKIFKIKFYTIHRLILIDLKVTCILM